MNKPEDAALVERISMAAIQSPAISGGATGAGAGGGQSQVINAIQIGGSQHVQIDVVVASVNRSELQANPSRLRNQQDPGFL
ncbi:MAG: hypothetical protein U0798_12430 [Gemmataceae bacterium]